LIVQEPDAWTLNVWLPVSPVTSVEPEPEAAMSLGPLKLLSLLSSSLMMKFPGMHDPLEQSEFPL